MKRALRWLKGNIGDNLIYIAALTIVMGLVNIALALLIATQGEWWKPIVSAIEGLYFIGNIVVTITTALFAILFPMAYVWGEAKNDKWTWGATVLEICLVASCYLAGKVAYTMYIGGEPWLLTVLVHVGLFIGGVATFMIAPATRRSFVEV